MRAVNTGGRDGKMGLPILLYRALESVSIASALSIALTIYPCQIRVHQTLTVNSPTSYSSEGVVVSNSGQFTPGGYLSTVIHTTLAGMHQTHNLPIVSPTRYQ